MISVGLRNKYKDFYNYLILVRGVRESTATYYVQKVGVLFRFSPVLSSPLINDTFVNLKQEGCSNSYLNRLLDVARLYTHYLKHSGLSYDESILSIKYLKEEAVLRSTMNDNEIEAFLNLPPTRNGKKELENYNRWTLFYKCLAYTGARPQEIAKLTVDLVDFGRNVFIVTEANSKTHTQRFIPIPPNIREELEEYVSHCDKYLFPSKQGGNARFGVPVFSQGQWGYNFHSRLKRLGIKRRGLVPYSLRHSMITRLLEEDVSIFKVQKLVGHTQLSTTAKYTHMTTKDIQNAITKHPLIRKATDPLQILSSFKEVIRSFEFEKNNKFKFNMNETNKGIKISIKINSY